MNYLLFDLICTKLVPVVGNIPPFIQGLINLANDASIWLCVLDPVIAIVVLSVNGIKGMIADDEQDDKVVKKRTGKVIFWAVFIFCVSGIVALVSSYFVVE